MNGVYDAFCMADRRFYDTIRTGSAREPFALATRPAPEGWRRSTTDHWVMHAPEPAGIPTQGWKIHVSGRPDNAERIIGVVWDYCTGRGLPFKFLGSRLAVFARNGKYAGRGGSGKLVTIYPRDDAELELACKDLDQALTGEPGPYILSDLRWAAGPVHVRYGGFVPRYCTDDHGGTVLAIEDASGTLVPDRRGPTFALPPWVALPDFLAPHLAARSTVTVAGLPYDIHEALHFSNGGGVYAATDRRTGDRVVLKEARPHAGLSGDGADAVTRLRHERDVLARLAGIDAVPRLVEHFALGEHEFLVMEHVAGDGLNDALVQRYPLLAATVDDGAVAGYGRWARDVHAAVERAIAAIHARGLAYGDLHLRNVILRPDGRVALIDFEVADELDAGRRPGIGAPGFAAPPDRSGAALDHYALACLRLALLLPLETLLGLDRAKAADLAEVAAATFPVPRRWLDEAVAAIAPAPAAAPARPRLDPDHADGAGWEQVRSDLAAGIRASATPGRDDRLFPGDPAQFDTGGIDIAHGAAGVLYALDVTGAGRRAEHEDWLIARARRPADGTRLGFYDGLHGVAHVLHHLGHHDEALRLVEACLGERWDTAGDDLAGGVAGMGLNLAHLADATGDASLADAAGRATRLVADRLGPVDHVPRTSGGRHPHAGLLHGSAGRALLFVRMYERTGEPGLLDHAAVALRQDLRRCVRRERDGQLHVDEGWRTMPYLATGSTGIGLVLDRYLAHRHDDELAEAAAAIAGAARSVFYVQAGLFNGRAGMVLYLCDRRSPHEPAPADAVAQIRRLDWHALTHEGHLAFPGDQLLRLSMDLGTGSAGVLLALGAALHDRPVHLPFLGPARPLRPRPGADPNHHEANGRR
jgi:hypothetical protein